MDPPQEASSAEAPPEVASQPRAEVTSQTQPAPPPPDDPKAFYKTRRRAPRNFPITVRAIALALSYALPGPPKEKFAQIHAQTGVAERTIWELRKKAERRGFNYERDGLRILNEHLVDAHRSGRPRKDSKKANANMEAASAVENTNGSEEDTTAGAVDADAEMDDSEMAGQQPSFFGLDSPSGAFTSTGTSQNRRQEYPPLASS